MITLLIFGLCIILACITSTIYQIIKEYQLDLPRKWSVISSLSFAMTAFVSIGIYILIQIIKL